MNEQPFKQPDIEPQPDSAEHKPNGPAPRRKRRLILRALDVLIVLIALTGLVLILQPLYKHWQQDRFSEKLIENFDAGDGTITFDPDDLVVEGEAIESFSDIEPTEPFDTGSTTDPATPTVTQSEPTESQAKPQVVVQAIGRISIPVIDLVMPISEGATLYNLRVAIGHYTPSAPLGQDGRSVLLGHRMYTYGRHFNRLDEVAVDDQIIIEDKNFRYTYTVDQIDRVLPSELMAAIYAPADGSRIMLVTCDPVRVASHRLLVRGALTQTQPLN